ncbi:helix-turn-helix transcriptional regulator [Streptomyces sp. SID1121]|uniref:helix-turn-helix transcriptional regulator n=1 Tax=Streptomyces sp. SID1121 TaxID=3425888 RepID=UPI0040568264
MEFGRELRRWRERTRPESVGLPPPGPRRAPGLRREELGLVAGVSVDYVVRLEQGRATAPSAQVVDALSHALRLNPAERELFFQLAGLRPPDRGLVPARLAPGVRRLLDRLDGVPVSAYDATWNLLTANAMWTALMGEPPEPNIVRSRFGPGPTRVLTWPGQDDTFDVAIVSDLREASARYPNDPGLKELIAGLHGSSERFADVWESGVMARHESTRKTIVHPEVGELALDCDVLTVPGSDVRIVASTAEPGSEAAGKLALLAALGHR